MKLYLLLAVLLAASIAGLAGCNSNDNGSSLQPPNANGAAKPAQAK